jgi:CheY-like chemotaxis protein
MPHRIAIIDRVSALQFLYVSILMREGYSLSRHDEGTATVRILGQRRPDLILYGNIIGTVPGEWDFVDRLRDSPELARTPILLATTGCEMIRDSRQLASRANITLLAKPFTRAQLLDAVHAALAQPSTPDDSVDAGTLVAAS